MIQRSVDLYGDKSIYTAKATADDYQCSVDILLTIASTNSPTSANSFIYYLNNVKSFISSIFLSCNNFAASRIVFPVV